MERYWRKGGGGGGETQKDSYKLNVISSTLSNFNFFLRFLLDSFHFKQETIWHAPESNVINSAVVDPCWRRICVALQTVLWKKRSKTFVCELLVPDENFTSSCVGLYELTTLLSKGYPTSKQTEKLHSSSSTKSRICASFVACWGILFQGSMSYVDILGTYVLCLDIYRHICTYIERWTV